MTTVLRSDTVKRNALPRGARRDAREITAVERGLTAKARRAMRRRVTTGGRRSRTTRGRLAHPPAPAGGAVEVSRYTGPPRETAYRRQAASSPKESSCATVSGVAAPLAGSPTAASLEARPGPSTAERTTPTHSSA